jgi:hypothetical protein
MRSATPSAARQRPMPDTENNPGIAPAIVAAAVGRPLRTYEVRPRILAGTAHIQGAVEVRPQVQLERLADGSYTFDFSQAPPGLHNLTRAESAGARNVMRPALAREHRGLPIGGISDFSPMDSYVVGSKAAEAGLDLRMTYSSPRPR